MSNDDSLILLDDLYSGRLDREPLARVRRAREDRRTMMGAFYSKLRAQEGQYLGGFPTKLTWHGFAKFSLSHLVAWLLLVIFIGRILRFPNVQAPPVNLLAIGAALWFLFELAQVIRVRRLPIGTGLDGFGWGILSWLVACIVICLVIKPFQYFLGPYFAASVITALAVVGQYAQVIAITTIATMGFLGSDHYRVAFWSGDLTWKEVLVEIHWFCWNCMAAGFSVGVLLSLLPLATAPWWWIGVQVGLWGLAISVARAKRHIRMWPTDWLRIAMLSMILTVINGCAIPICWIWWSFMNGWAINWGVGAKLFVLMASWYSIGGIGHYRIRGAAYVRSAAWLDLVWAVEWRLAMFAAWILVSTAVVAVINAISWSGFNANVAVRMLLLIPAALLTFRLAIHLCYDGWPILMGHQNNFAPAVIEAKQEKIAAETKMLAESFTDVPKRFRDTVDSVVGESQRAAYNLGAGERKVVKILEQSLTLQPYDGSTTGWEARLT